MFGRATIRLGIGPHSSCYNLITFLFITNYVAAKNLLSACVRNLSTSSDFNQGTKENTALAGILKCCKFVLA